MKRLAILVSTAVLLAGSRGTLVSGQSRPASSPDPQSYSTATTAILVDVVVRDRKGKPVTDLTAADFEVYEDRVAQKIDTFTRVTRGGGIGVDVKWKHPGATVAIFPAGSVPPPSQARDAADQATTALVFDHLGEESLGLAQKATLEYVPMSGDSDVRVGVFATEPGVRVVQSYTTDRSAVRRAVSQIMPAGTSADQQKAERRDEVMDRRRELQMAQLSQSTAAATAATAANGGQMGLTEAELRMLEMERTQIDGFDQLDREHKGYDTTLALMGVIRSLAETPGRKSIVFFSEGLPVSPVLSARFDDLIDAANRSNVTVYAVDANGLRTRSNFCRRPQAAPGVHRRPDDAEQQRQQREQSAAVAGLRTSRGHGAARLADGPCPARRRHRRVPRGAVEQPDAGLQAHRRGQPVPLHAVVHADATRCSTASSARSW